MGLRQNLENGTVSRQKTHPVPLFFLGSLTGMLGSGLGAIFFWALYKAGFLAPETLGIPDSLLGFYQGSVLTVLFLLVATCFVSAAVFNINLWRKTYILDNDEITTVIGRPTFPQIWHTTVINAPIQQIRSVDVQKTLISKMLGYGTLRIVTAGDHEDLIMKGHPEPGDWANFISEKKKELSQGNNTQHNNAE